MPLTGLTNRLTLNTVPVHVNPYEAVNSKGHNKCHLKLQEFIQTVHTSMCPWLSVSQNLSMLSNLSNNTKTHMVRVIHLSLSQLTKGKHRKNIMIEIKKEIKIKALTRALRLQLENVDDVCLALSEIVGSGELSVDNNDQVVFYTGLNTNEDSFDKEFYL